VITAAPDSADLVFAVFSAKTSDLLVPGSFKLEKYSAVEKL
jgi:hypothetical protein